MYVFGFCSIFLAFWFHYLGRCCWQSALLFQDVTKVWRESNKHSKKLFSVYAFYLEYYSTLMRQEPVAVAERSEAWTVFDRSEAAISGSNSSFGMDVYCVSAFFCVYVALCLGRGLAASHTACDWSRNWVVSPLFLYGRKGASGKKKMRRKTCHVKRRFWFGKL
jgi:hypothetical protein